MFGLPGDIVGLLVCIALLAFGFAIFRWAILASAHHKSTISHAQAAQEIGLEPDRDVDLSVALDGSELFRDTLRKERKFNFCYVAQADGMLIRILEFQLDKGDLHVLGIKIPVLTTVLAFEAEDLGLPKFLAKPKMLVGIGIPPLFKAGMQVDIDGEFRKHYSVTTEDKLETDLRKLFVPEVCALLQEHRLVIESNRNRLLLYYPYGKIIPNQLWKEHLEFGVRLLAAMRRAWERRSQGDERDIVVDEYGQLRRATSAPS